jgi:protease I
MMGGIVTRGLLTGVALTAASGATMMTSSAIERGSPWAGLNAMATAIGLRRRRVSDSFEAGVTPIGIALLTGGLLAWGLAYQGALAGTARRGGLVSGVLSGLGGYAFDELVLPRWVIPNFRRKMGVSGTMAKYVALGIASALMARQGAAKKLEGRRVAILAADGFEKLELTIPMRALRAEGAHVEVISLRRGKIGGVHMNIPGGRVRVDRTIEEANPADFDALFIPGGFISPDFLRQSEPVREFVRAMDRAGKPIASICHGPWVLASSGVLQERHVASWPGIRDDVINAGGTWRDEPVVRDGNLVTSRGPQDIPAFTAAIIDQFAVKDPLTERALPAASSPEPTSPPTVALAGAALLPKAARLKRGLGNLAMFAVGGLAVCALRKLL